MTSFTTATVNLSSTQSNLSNATLSNLHPNVSLTSTTTSISTSSDNSLYTISSPFELNDIPDESEFVLLKHSKFTLSLKMLDKVLYLRSDDSSKKVTPLRGYLCIYVKKPIRLSKIKLQLNGTLTIKLFPISEHPAPNSPFVKDKFLPMFSQSRSWQYKQNDKVLESDYFAKGSFTYPFQFLIPNKIPESMANIFGSTNYSLTVTVVPFSRSLATSLLSHDQYTGSLPIQIVQCDADLEEVSTTVSDALSIGNWRNYLYYKMVVSNRQLTIGGYLKFYVKILPINPLKYTLKAINIFLDQITEYDVKPFVSKNDIEKYHNRLSHTERILLDSINIDSFENDIETWEFDYQIPKEHKRYEILEKKENMKAFVKIVPTTSAIENKVCHFKVSHQIKLSIRVEETTVDENAISFEDSDLISSYSMRSRSQSIDKMLHNSRAEKQDNLMIKRMAKLLNEPSNKKNKVDLTLDTEVEILKDESLVGNSPPPSYFDARTIKKVYQTNEKSALNTESNTIPNSLFDSLRLKQNSKQKGKLKLNFIVPPAYEEIEELSGLPQYFSFEN